MLEVTKLVSDRSVLETLVSRLPPRELYHSQRESHMNLPAVYMFAAVKGFQESVGGWRATG